MTLEEKIRPHTKSWDCYNDEPLKYNHTRKVCKIFDEFAIDFAEWVQNNCDEFPITDQKLILETYKKQKGL